VGVAAPQPAVDHIGGAGHGGEQRVVAPDVVVGEAGAALLGQPVGLNDAGIDIQGDRPVARPRARGPGPPQRLGRDFVQLSGMTPSETAQERADGRRRRNPESQHRLSGARPQTVAVVDAVAAGQRRVDHRHGLLAHIGPTRGVTQVDLAVEQLPQPQVLGQRGRQNHPGVGHRVLVVEGHANGVQAMQ
jgi:hypothetical protein